jgi:hypothetical protein
MSRSLATGQVSSHRLTPVIDRRRSGPIWIHRISAMTLIPAVTTIRRSVIDLPDPGGSAHENRHRGRSKQGG